MTEVIPILVSVYKPVLQSLAEQPMLNSSHPPSSSHAYQPLRPNQVSFCLFSRLFLILR